MKKYTAIGIDVSDKTMKAIGLDDAGEVAWRDSVACLRRSVTAVFSKIAPCAIALETGNHSGWLSRTLAACGHRVVVANARKLRAIWANERKSDWTDAEMLARMLRADPKLLRPVHLRSEEAQRDLNVLKARDALVGARTKLVNTVRSIIKNLGFRVPKCSTEAFTKRCRTHVPASDRTAVEGLLEQIEALTRQIRLYDAQVEYISKRYQEAVDRMSAVPGVGPITSLAMVLNLEAPERFTPRRNVGAFLGMTPKRDQSGELDKQLGITHAGNMMVRRLLVGSAHYILGAFGSDSDLRRFGLRLMERGGKNAKKRAVVAVARKLSVLLIRLWETGDTYEPLRNAQRHTGCVA